MTGFSQTPARYELWNGMAIVVVNAISYAASSCFAVVEALDLLLRSLQGEYG